MGRLSVTKRAVLAYLSTVGTNEFTSPDIARASGRARSSVHDALINMYRDGLVTRRWLEDPETLVEIRVYQLTSKGHALAQAIDSGVVASAPAAKNLGYL